MRFSRAPETKDEMDLLDDMKNKWGFRWSGLSESGKWKTDKLAVIAFEDEVFLRRVVACKPNISFFTVDGHGAPQRRDFIAST